MLRPFSAGLEQRGVLITTYSMGPPWKTVGLNTAEALVTVAHENTKKTLIERLSSTVKSFVRKALEGGQKLQILLCTASMHVQPTNCERSTISSIVLMLTHRVGSDTAWQCCRCGFNSDIWHFVCDITTEHCGPEKNWVRGSPRSRTTTIRGVYNVTTQQRSE